MAELATAAKAANMPLGWYYSPRDWDHEAYAPKPEWERGQRTQGDLSQYQRFVKQQITELIERYGPVALFWFDGQDNQPEEVGTDDLLAHIREIDPAILVNDRIGYEGYEADFALYEGNVPESGLSRDWEACFTLNYSWGFDKNDHRWMPMRDLIHRVCDIVSKGGNLLLNVGPDGDGQIPEPAADRLRKLGDWMNLNGEAIYGTRRWKRAQSDSVRYTRKENAIYAMIFDQVSGEVELPPEIRDRTDGTLQTVLLKAPEGECYIGDLSLQDDARVTLVATGQACDWRHAGTGCKIKLPESMPGDYAWALRVEGLYIPLTPNP